MGIDRLHGYSQLLLFLVYNLQPFLRIALQLWCTGSASIPEHAPKQLHQGGDPLLPKQMFGEDICWVHLAFNLPEFYVSMPHLLLDP